MKFLSLIVAAASGKFGGLVGSRNRYGMYFRSHAIPVNPSSALQNAIRNMFSLFVAAWKASLTAAQRLQWKVYGDNVSITDSLGASHKLTGQNWFISSNVARKQAGLAIVEDGPTDFTRALLTAPTVSAVSTTSALSIGFTATDPWAMTSGGALTIAVSPPQNPTVNFYVGPYQYAGRVLGAASPPASPASVVNPYGAPPSGTKTFVQLRAVEADGRTSVPFPSSKLVA